MSATATQSVEPVEDLLVELEAPHRAVQTAFDAGRPLVAVAWSAAHLAAVESALLPAACRLPDVPVSEISRHRIAHRRADTAAYRLDRFLTGAMLAGQASAPRMLAEFRSAFADHVDCERRIVEHVARHLDADAQRSLADALHRACACAPTRPHPHAPHRRPVGSLAFRLQALIDHVRDVLDNRHLDIAPARPAPSAPGRWGMYVLGRCDLPQDSRSSSRSGD